MRLGTECRRLGAAVSLAHVGAQDVACVLRRAGQHHAKRVDDAALRDGNRLGGKRSNAAEPMKSTTAAVTGACSVI